MSTPDSVSVQPLTLAKTASHATRALCYQPRDKARATVIIAPAMGVKQRFYAPLARWLAVRGWRTLTFDYRGIGQSAPTQLRGFATDINDWVEADAGAALAHVHGTYPETEVIWLGHSLGGQTVGMVPGSARLSRIVTVASGSGYWRHMTDGMGLKSLALWYGIMPAAIAVAGYFPGRRLGLIGDIPRGAMQQWRRWCLDPDYLFGEEGATVREAYAQIQAPVAGFAIDDDEMMSWQGINHIHRQFIHAPVTLKRLNPKDLGLAGIGHFGFFREHNGELLWPRYLLPALQGKPA